MDPKQATTIRGLAETRATEPGALLQILRAIPDDLGLISEDPVAIVPDVLNLSRADVHGVVSFYHLFRARPAGEHTLYVCRAEEACQSMESRALAESSEP
jgi:formate dehydrogenase subunit gamma